MHKSTIYRWRSGELPNVTLDNVRAVAEAVGDDPEIALRAAGSAIDDTGSRQADEDSRPAQAFQATPFGLWLADLTRARTPSIDRHALGKLIGVDPAEIAGWIMGPERPTIQDVENIARVLNVDFREALVQAGYGRQMETPPPRSLAHARARELDEMLDPQSALTDAERERLEVAVDVLLAGFREQMHAHLHVRQAS